MKIGATSSELHPCVAAIGFFDGVHRGHRYLIEQVQEIAAERELSSAVVTFPVHPRKVLYPDFCPELLTTCEERTALLEQTSIDYCLMLDFTSELAQLSAREFMCILKQRYHIEVLVIGYDHRFGHNRCEGFDEYVRYGKELGMEVIPARACYLNKGETQDDISSSRIRRLLHAGEILEANECLGYEYFLQGTVVGGYHVGRTIGFPTANLRVENPDKLIPADGVYAVRVSLEGKTYGGMLSIGNRPTINNGIDRSIEVNIFDFHSNIYNQPMRLSFVCRTRPELKFASVDELVAQLHKDEAEVKKILYTSLH